MKLFPLAALVLVHALGCGSGGGDSGLADGGPAGDPDGRVFDYPAPRSDLVSPAGTANTIDVATWNIENFPRAESTASLMADLITSLALDLVAVQEIEDETAFQELVDRLPDHDGLLSSHTYGNGSYQKVGYIYRSDLLTLSGGALLFQTDGFDFPRPPMQVVVTVNDGSADPFDFLAITLHLKAGVDGADRERRRSAMVSLEAHVSDVLNAGQENEILLLGDFNEILDTEDGRSVFAPFLDAPGDYSVETDALAQAGEFTFIPSERMLDHVISTGGLGGEIVGANPTIRPLEDELSVYLSLISDHRPVVVSLSP